VIPQQWREGCDLLTQKDNTGNSEGSGPVPPIDAYIAPWALPNEEIPLHLTWKREVFSEIRLILPKSFRLKGLENVESFETDGTVVRILSTKRAKASEVMHFGAVITYPDLPKNLAVGGKIAVEFWNDGRLAHTIELVARVFRPTMQILEVPKALVIGEGTTPQDIPLRLRYVGFGDIRLRIAVRVGGRLVSQGESLVYELLKRLRSAGLNLDEPDTEKPTNVGTKSAFRVEPEYVREVVAELQKKVDEGLTPSEELDAEALEDLKDWLAEARTKEQYAQVLYGRVREFIVDILVDLLARRPISSVTLSDARTKVRTSIRAPITRIDLELHYADKLENEYEPVLVSFSVEDRRRENSPFQLDVPIVIEEMEDRSFLDVVGMNVEMVS